MEIYYAVERMVSEPITPRRAEELRISAEKLAALQERKQTPLPVDEESFIRKRSGLTIEIDEDRIALALSMRMASRSYKEISGAIGFSAGYVRKLLLKTGMKFPKRAPRKGLI